MQQEWRGLVLVDMYYTTKTVQLLIERCHSQSDWTAPGGNYLTGTSLQQTSRQLRWCGRSAGRPGGQ